MILRNYQVPHAEKLLGILKQRHSALDGSSCGTGKTYSAAWIAARLAVKTLVVCPLSVVPTWEAIMADAGVADFKVINWEMAWRRLGHKIPCGKGSYFQWNEEWPLFIFDEVHRAQSSTSNQGKLLLAAARQGRLTKGRILALSATAADTPLKMRPLGFALELFEPSAWFHWLDAHGCPELTFGPKDDPSRQWKQRVFLKNQQTHVMALLNREIYEAKGARLRIEEIPDFPTTQIAVRLLSGHDKEVQRLSRELKAFYDERTALADMSDDDRAKLTYARQAMETAKVPSLVDMMADALETSRVVVFANYSATLDALAVECDRMKWSHGFIRGEQTADQRQQVIAEFQADRLGVVLANVQAGGVGVSLHSLAKVPRTAFLCPTFSSVDMLQCLGRVHRDGGGPSRQFVVFFKDTVEERVAKAVQLKIERIETLNDGDMGAETPITSRHLGGFR